MKIAIIGTGISGLGAAYMLHPHHEITVYEKNATPGGHSRTVDVKIEDTSIPVDTGFIVFNKRNYPLLTRLFDHLKVPVAKSNMSFGVSIQNGWLEYGSVGLRALFAQPENLINGHYLGMLRDIFTFNKRAVEFADSNISLGECLNQLGMRQWFRDYYLLAMGAAIWSTPLEQMLAFPASTFIRFFSNHGLLTINDQPQWYTVKGSSREYIKLLCAPFKDRIRLNCGAVRVTRTPEGVEVVDTEGHTERYDQIVFACQPAQVLKMLEKPTTRELSILSAFIYQPNRAVLHRDTSFMPKRRAAWSSWVYLSEQEKDKSPQVSLSYWMNNLQPLETRTPIIVTLNPAREPAAGTLHDSYDFEHPVFDGPAIAAQKRVCEIQGSDRLWYTGAWQRYGFHEDGLLSAVIVSSLMGIKAPWL